MSTKAKKEILVVDDEPNVLVTYRLILQQQGFTVNAAISSEEARRCIDDHKIDLLLCDLSLEKQESGFDVIEYLRKKNAAVPAVLLTGYATQDASDWAAERGIPVLYKPIDIQQLLETINNLLQNEGGHNAARQATK